MLTLQQTDHEDSKCRAQLEKQSDAEKAKGNIKIEVLQLADDSEMVNYLRSIQRYRYGESLENQR